jgi:hypothetical protein
MLVNHASNIGRLGIHRGHQESYCSGCDMRGACWCEGKGKILNAARLKRASLLKVALVAVMLAGALLGLTEPSKAQSAPLSDLTVLKTGPATATQGDTVTWDITMTNIGSGDAVVALPTGSGQKTILQDVFTSSTPEHFLASRWTQEAAFPYDHCFGGTQEPGRLNLGWFLCPEINQPVDVIPPGGVRGFTVAIEDLERVMNSAGKPHRNANISVSSVLRRSPVFRISKLFLSKFITASRSEPHRQEYGYYELRNGGPGQCNNRE